MAAGATASADDEGLVVRHLRLVQLEVLRDGRRRRPFVLPVQVALGHADNLRVPVGNGDSRGTAADRLDLGIWKHLLHERERRHGEGEREGRKTFSERFFLAKNKRKPRFTLIRAAALSRSWVPPSQEKP